MIRVSYRKLENLGNPGWYWACCGLFEVAGALSPEAKAYFTEGEFLIEGPVTMYGCLQELKGCKISEEPCVEGLPFVRLQGKRFSILLNWWVNPSGQESPFKAWRKGIDNPREMLERMVKTLDPQIGEGEFFEWERKMGGRKGKKCRFGLDVRSAWTARSLGYSANQLGLPDPVFTCVEAFSAIGFQTFKPREEEEGYSYCAWFHPLSLPLARLAASLAIKPRSGALFRTKLEKRGKSYKSFEVAILMERW